MGTTSGKVLPFTTGEVTFVVTRRKLTYSFDRESH